MILSIANSGNELIVRPEVWRTIHEISLAHIKFKHDTRHYKLRAHLFLISNKNNIYVCVYVFMCVGEYVCMCVSVYVNVCMCLCVHLQEYLRESVDLRHVLYCSIA